MKKTYLFAESLPSDTVLVPPGEGVMRTERLQADVHYEFDFGDSTIKLSIDGEWFSEEDLDDLIDFARAAKAMLIAGE